MNQMENMKLILGFLLIFVAVFDSIAYDCDVEMSTLGCIDNFVIFDEGVIAACYKKKNLEMDPKQPLAWVKNVELSGCVVTTEKLLNGSSLLSSRLQEYLKQKFGAFYDKIAKPAVEKCYGDMTEVQEHRLEFFMAKSLETADGGQSSSPVASYILECFYGELIKQGLKMSKLGIDFCEDLIKHVNECGTW